MAEVHALRDVDGGDAENGANGDTGSHTIVTMKQDPRDSRKRSIFRRYRTCLISSVVVLILIVILIVILAFTVFKAKDPSFKVESVELENFSSNPLPPPRTNMTLRITATVHNPNIASFKYGNSTAYMYYRGILVGVAPIPASEMKAHGTKAVSLDLTLELDTFVSSPAILISDVIAGAFPMSFDSTISGKVNIANIVKKHITASAVCNTTILSNFTESAIDCQYHTKL